jgi:hypothetical protein
MSAGQRKLGLGRSGQTNRAWRVVDTPAGQKSSGQTNLIVRTDEAGLQSGGQTKWAWGVLDRQTGPGELWTDKLGLGSNRQANWTWRVVDRQPRPGEY